MKLKIIANISRHTLEQLAKNLNVDLLENSSDIQALFLIQKILLILTAIFQQQFIDYHQLYLTTSSKYFVLL